MGHGGNDAQKTMGIIASLLFSAGLLGDKFYIPFWVVFCLLYDIVFRDHVRGMAHCQNHGAEDRKTAAGGWFLR